MSQTYLQERAELFKELKALFEFDQNGILPCMAPGMAGPIDFPIGYLDMSKVSLEDQPFDGRLVLIWSTDEKAIICFENNNQREATNEELSCALAHYTQAVNDYREEISHKCTKDGQEIPKYLQSRLGMIPYFSK